MNFVLTDRQQEITKTVCATGNASNVQIGNKVIDGTISIQEIELFCELVSNEFMMKGVKETYEPNEYGKELEELLDVVNRKRLQS